MIRVHSIRFFLLTAALFGSIFAVVVPPFQAPDEFNHFFRAWQVSEGQLVGIKSDNRLGGDLPESLSTVADMFRPLPFHLENRIKSSTIFYNLDIPLEAHRHSFMDFPNTAVYAPTAYLPQAMAIFIGRNLELTPLSIFYLSRFSTLIFWLSMIYAALKIVPRRRRGLLVLLALLPSSLILNSSASGDVVTNGAAFLAIALFMRLILEKRKIAGWKILTLFIATLIVSLNKVAYFPIVFLILLSRKENFGGGNKRAAFAAALILVNIAVVLFWSLEIQSLLISFADYDPQFRIGQQLNEGVNQSAQVAYILHNPLTFTKIAIVSIFKTMPHTIVHYIGKFGWEKNYLPLWLIVPLFLTLIFQAISPQNRSSSQSHQTKLPLSIFPRIGIFSIGILMTFSVAAAMYAIWNPVGAPFIENLSGKYFIPIFPLFLLALPTVERFSKYEKMLNGATVALIWLSLIWSVFQILTRYFIF